MYMHTPLQKTALQAVSSQQRQGPLPFMLSHREQRCAAVTSKAWHSTMWHLFAAARLPSIANSVHYLLRSRLKVQLAAAASYHLPWPDTTLPGKSGASPAQ